MMPQRPIQSQPWFERLRLPAYTMSDAARFAQTPKRTVGYWFRSQEELPAALPGRRSSTELSYLQLVEVAFVAACRDLHISLQSIRRAREYLAREFATDFPFATLRLKTDGRHVLHALPEASGKDPDLIAADLNGQIMWQALSGRISQFEYEAGIAIRWWLRGLQSPIVIDPRIAFGVPAVRGIPTWVLKGRRLAGDAADEIGEDYGLTREEVLAALEFEGVVAVA